MDASHAEAVMPESTRKLLVSMLSLLAIIGVAELIASCTVINSSSGYFIGGIYSAFATLCIGTFASRFNRRGALNDYRSDSMETGLRWLSVAAVCCFIVNLVAAVVQGVDYKFVNNLETCVDSDGCYGECDQGNIYYKLATDCYAANSDSSCSCIEYGDTDDDGLNGCYNYDNMKSCKNFYKHTADQIHISMSFTIVATIVCAFLALVKCCSAPEEHQHTLTEPLSTEYNSSDYQSRNGVYMEAHAVASVYVENPTIVTVNALSSTTTPTVRSTAAPTVIGHPAPTPAAPLTTAPTVS